MKGHSKCYRKVRRIDMLMAEGLAGRSITQGISRNVHQSLVQHDGLRHLSHIHLSDTECSAIFLDRVHLNIMDCEDMYSDDPNLLQTLDRLSITRPIIDLSEAHYLVQKRRPSKSDLANLKRELNLRCLDLVTACKPRRGLDLSQVRKSTCSGSPEPMLSSYIVSIVFKKSSTVCPLPNKCR